MFSTVFSALSEVLELLELELLLDVVLEELLELAARALASSEMVTVSPESEELELLDSELPLLTFSVPLDDFVEEPSVMESESESVVVVAAVYVLMSISLSFVLRCREGENEKQPLPHID
jgi:hypothetical protein